MRSLTKNALSAVNQLSPPKRYGIYNTETKDFKYGISELSRDVAWAALKNRLRVKNPKPCFVVKPVLF